MHRTLTAAAALVLTACAAPPPAADLAITGVTVLPMDGSPPRPGHTVLVRDGAIVGIAPASKTSGRGVIEIDGSGRFLLPSLVDTHVHVCDSDDQWAFLAHGIGLVRNMDGTPFHLLMRESLADGRLEGARLTTTGPYTNAPRIADPAAAREAVRGQAAAGYDAIKIHGPLDLASLRELGDAARQAGLPVVGHIPRDQDFADVAATGAMTEISHAEEYLYTLYGLRDAGISPDVRAEAVRLTVDGDIALTPTLTMYRGILRQVADVEAAVAAVPMRAVGPFAMRSFGPEGNRYAQRFERSDTTVFRESLDEQYALVGELARAGVTILAGTDANAPVAGPGYSLREELELLVASGLTTEQALAAATSAAWRALTGDPIAGVVVEGGAAELLLLDASPLEDIRNVARVAGVVRGGRWYSAESLDARLDSIHALRVAEQPFVDRLWDNTLEDALPWLEAARESGEVPTIRAATWRCQSQRAVRDGVPEVALEALDLALADFPGDPLTLAYRALVESMLEAESRPD
ncbi:MAG: amidohydrolase family protein [Gemmatimonadota bacterium]|nr:amidohydrolase family protein [Gemmatimonadota bacterium]